MKKVEVKEDCLDNDCSTCVWHIAAAEFEHCFWVYVEQKSNISGYMPPMTQTEISTLLGIPYSKVGEIYHTALEKIQLHDEFDDLVEIFHD